LTRSLTAKVAACLLLAVVLTILCTSTASAGTEPVAYGVDISNWRGNPYQIIAAVQAPGFTFMGVYITQASKGYKCITPAIKLALEQMGMRYFLIFEERPRRPFAGYNAGRQDAWKVMAALDRLGLPHSTTVYFATDTSVRHPGQVAAYYMGVRDAFGFPQGVYGGGVVVQYLFDNGLVSRAFQCPAWSGKVGWDPRDTMRQVGVRKLGGRKMDTIWAMETDFGQIPRP
jgi:hypothetical protein